MQATAIAIEAPSRPLGRAGLSRAAFETLYAESRDAIYAYVAGMLRDRHAAEDVTALAFERAFRRRESFNARRGNERAWLFGIARNAALDELRKRGRSQELTTDPPDAAAPDPAESAADADRRTALRAALAELEPRERELISLKFFAGLSNQEIAGLLGISESNTGTRLHRALGKVRQLIGEEI